MIYIDLGPDDDQANLKNDLFVHSIPALSQVGSCSHGCCRRRQPRSLPDPISISFVGGNLLGKIPISVRIDWWRMAAREHQLKIDQWEPTVNQRNKYK